ncbi:MAG TPA: hypothetical protein VEZ14_02585 [Dehalococcoidia bacterium]|nr:hypothetical protein [Dehalococcoidia bacterium]
MGEIDHFRIFFWQRFAPLFALPVFAAILAFSPISAGWGPTEWKIAAAVTGIAVAVYLLDAWRKSDVQLSDTAMALYIGGKRETWPYEKLLKVKQIGSYRVRMCYDVGLADQHMHVTVDLFNSNGFVDALLDRYAESQGHWLPELPSHDGESSGDSDTTAA